MSEDIEISSPNGETIFVARKICRAGTCNSQHHQLVEKPLALPPSENKFRWGRRAKSSILISSLHRIQSASRTRGERDKAGFHIFTIKYSSSNACEILPIKDSSPSTITDIGLGESEGLTCCATEQAGAPSLIRGDSGSGTSTQCNRQYLAPQYRWVAQSMIRLYDRYPLHLRGANRYKHRGTEARRTLLSIKYRG